MERSDELEAEREQLVDDPLPHIELAVHRVRPGADAAKEEPLEHDHFGREKDDEGRADERRRAQVHPRVPSGVDVDQEPHPRRYGDEEDGRKNESEPGVERHGRGAAEGSPRRRWRDHLLHAGHAPGGRTRPSLTLRNPRACGQERQVFKPRAVLHHRPLSEDRACSNEAPSPDGHRTDDEFPALDYTAVEQRLVVNARVVTY